MFLCNWAAPTSGHMLNQFMKVFSIPVTNVFTKLLRRVTSGHMLNQFMKVFVILATIVIIKLLTRVTSEHIKNTNIMS